MVTTLEWIVVAFAILAVVKMAVMMTSRKRWLPVIEEVYDNHGLFSLLFLIVAGWIFYLVAQSLTIVQIVGVMIMAVLLMSIAFLHYGQEIKSSMKKMVSAPLSGWIWVYILIWIILLGWAVYQIFI